MGWRRFQIAFLALVFAVCLPTSALAEKRVALIIGNSAYQHAAPLANPKNDATDMTTKLKGLGFEVVSGLDLDLTGMRLAVRDFVDRLNGADMALFFYAGHGLQVNGNNYMAPVDAKLASYNHLDFEALPVDLVLSAMERNTKINLVFLDACRDNPLAENLARSMGSRSGSIGRDLAKLGSGVGSLIAFATQPGNIALDGSGRNSPFTSALLKHLGTPGQDVTRDLIHVRRSVLEATGGKQVPWENSSLTGEIILLPNKDEPKSEPQPEAKASDKQDNSVELTFWNSIKDTSDKGYYELYLQQYPNGAFAALARFKIEMLKGAAEKEAQAKAAAQEVAKEKAESDRKSAELAQKAGQERLAKEKAETERLLKEKAEGQWVANDKADTEQMARQAEQERLAVAELDALRVAKEKIDLKALVDAQKETEIAKLEEPPVRSVSELAMLTADPIELVRSVQIELARLGCLSVKADGKWGSSSAKALAEYSIRQGIKLVSLEPSAEVLDRLKATTVRVCPLVCGKGLEEKNGRCEKVRQEATVEPKAIPKSSSKTDDGNKAATPTAKSKNSQQSRNDRECYRCRQGSGGTIGNFVCIQKGQPLNTVSADPASCTKL